MPPAGFEPTIPASVRPQTHALDRAATGIALGTYIHTYIHTYIRKYKQIEIDKIIGNYIFKS